MSGAVKKIAYLFGAGATHAELLARDPDMDPEVSGLLISNVSKRVIWRASQDPDYTKSLELVSGTNGSLSVELLISLIESSKVRDSADKTLRLKKMVEADITTVISKFGAQHFFLHKGLLELHLHKKVRVKEQLLGLISLNYDDIIDRAYQAVLDEKPNYCFSLNAVSKSASRIPLLKLHGSFNWKNQYVLCKKRDVEIVPLGSSKSYLHAPYGCIWNRAFDILAKCDVLRVVGCSLSPNDLHLIDLLFKAQLERKTPFELEIIDLEEAGEIIQKTYGFFSVIKRLSQLGLPTTSVTGPPNPFKTWLHYTADRLLSLREFRATKHIKKAAA